MTINEKSIKRSESGSVILWVLIAIALLAMLSFVFTEGTRSGEQSIGQEKARLMATEIIDYGAGMRRAVQNMMIQGTGEDEINFENAVIVGYSSPCTASECKVFNPNGGGMSFKRTDESWFDTSNASYGTLSNWSFQGETPVENVGTTDAELTMMLGVLNKTLCMAINDQLGITNAASDAPSQNDIDFSTSTDLFDGTYNNGTVLGDVAGSAALAGKQAGCVKENTGCGGGACYIFYQVLLAR